MPSEEEQLQEIERGRLQLKRERVKSECATLPQMFSLWQETTDLLFRTNLGDESRVEELSHLRTITFALIAEAHKRTSGRERLQKLDSVLRTLMPREWFQDPATRAAVATAVHDANVEVQELYFASLRPGTGLLVEARTELHAAIVGIAGRLSNVVELLGRYSNPSIALVILSHHVQSPEVDPEPDTPDRAETWRTVIQDLQSHVSKARKLWDAKIDGVDGRLRLDFTRASRGSVKCGPIERNSCHEVVLAIGRLILDPQDTGAVWENELGAIGDGIVSPDRLRLVARLHVARELDSRPWWQALSLGLQREFAEVAGADDGSSGAPVTAAEPPEASPLTCIVERQKPDRATVREGPTTVAIRGSRRVWLLLAVAQARRGLSWEELLQADLQQAGVILDRRIRSRAAAGAETPANTSGSIPRSARTPRLATKTDSLQNLGTRIRKDLGKLAYHWQQDGHGVAWNADCQ